MRRPLVLCFVLAMFAMLSMPRASHAGPTLRAAAFEVRAGELVVLTWSDLPRGAHEVELEVSLGGGRWLRISPELDASVRSFTWRVPREFAGDARVRLRWGGKGYESEGDFIALRIEPTLTTRHPRPGDEWWNAHAAEPLAPSAWRPTQAAFAPLVLPAAVPASPDGFGANRTEHARTTLVRDDAAIVVRPRPLTPSPQRVTPLRN